MSSRLLTIFLALGIILSGTIFVSSYDRNMRFAGNHEGYEPVQPIAYSHRLHAGELGIGCLHCHNGAETSRHAGVPAAATCMNCHSIITAPFLHVRAEDELAAQEKREAQLVVSPEIKKLYETLGLNDERKPDPSKEPRPLQWVKVHTLPDFVYFEHRVHVSAGVECQTCHGEVQTMERVRQVSDLSMGWCVNCHRESNAEGVKGKRVYASTDCSACHY